MKHSCLLIFLFAVQVLSAQTNIICTSAVAEQVLTGNYNAQDYAPAAPTPVWPEVVAAGLQADISPDSLKAYIIKLASFRTRNSGSDTVSATEGFG
ncbi:MAG: hypothetical protein IT261_09505, partial [Saprospiraceae bacterium]|nr:hypothetical protein [Saprospiraceae bacterium]